MIIILALLWTHSEFVLCINHLKIVFFIKKLIISDIKQKMKHAPDGTRLLTRIKQTHNFCNNLEEKKTKLYGQSLKLKVREVQEGRLCQQ